MSELVRVESVDDGAFWRVTFGRGTGNILDLDTMRALTDVWREAGRTTALKGVCLEGSGEDFSFGASVQEHMPDRVSAMLDGIRRLSLSMLESAVVITVAVRGRCLGGGLEVASLCQRIFADPVAMFGQPEIALGVFAPIASVVLPGRIGRAHAEDLCLTGRLVSADEARAMGLIEEVVIDPADAALAWMRAWLSGRSASSLRFAVRAVRADLVSKLETELPRLEAMYVKELMATSDAVEGLRAFLEKRPASWKDA